mmetsp:Transcript_54772/g.130840  ORF Transcript_54772/g.130840 Transcript_54772/m.130840 type:complete len:269 (-) Transcript_54772:755-1561(-)
MEDAILEAQCLHCAHCHLSQLDLLLSRQQRRGHCPGLVEIWLQRGAIVGDGCILPLSVRHDHVHIHLLAIKVGLQQEALADHVLRCHCFSLLPVVLHQRATGDHDGAELGVPCSVGLLQVFETLHLLHSQRCCPRHGLQHRREAHDVRGLQEILLAGDLAVRRRGKPIPRQRPTGGVLVTSLVRGLGRGPRQPQELREARGQRHRQLRKGADPVHLAHGGVALARLDRRQARLDNLPGGLVHVDGDELHRYPLIHQALAPARWAVDQH